MSNAFVLCKTLFCQPCLSFTKAEPSLVEKEKCYLHLHRYSWVVQQIVQQKVTAVCSPVLTTGLCSLSTAILEQKGLKIHQKITVIFLVNLFWNPRTNRDEPELPYTTTLYKNYKRYHVKKLILSNLVTWKLRPKKIMTSLWLSPRSKQQPVAWCLIPLLQHFILRIALPLETKQLNIYKNWSI